MLTPRPSVCHCNGQSTQDGSVATACFVTYVNILQTGNNVQPTGSDVIAGIFPQSLQVQTQVTFASLG
jgi:hypothetical protein